MRRLLAGLFALSVTIGVSPVGADQGAEVFGRVFPGADGFGAIAGTPPAAPAYKDGALLGYVFRTHQVVGSLGFSGKPLDVAVGLDRAGRVTGAEIVEHHEPILIIGVSEADLDAFVAQYRGIDIRGAPRPGKTVGGRRVDAVSRATVSSLAINDAIVHAARAVARGRGILTGAAAALDLDSYAPADWQSLLADGAVVRLARLVLADGRTATHPA